MQSSDAAEQVVKFTLDGVQTVLHIAGKGALELAKLLISEARKSETTKGKSSLTKMLKSKEPIKVFEVQDKDLKRFCKMAKKYGISYHVMKDKKSNNGKCDILTYAKDSGMVARVMKRLDLGMASKGTIKSTVVRAKDERKSVKDELKTTDKKAVTDKFIDELFSKPEPKVADPLRPRASDTVLKASSKLSPRPIKKKPSVLKTLETFKTEEKKKAKPKTKTKTKTKGKTR